MKKLFIERSKVILSSLVAFSIFLIPFENCSAFPVYAQQAYTNPREATGRLVCANCHLAQKPVAIETPTSVLPDTVFEAVVKIPYADGLKQIQGNGTKGGLNVGGIVVLPEGFKLAPKDRLSSELKAKTKGVYIQPYSAEKPNILVVGPIGGEKNREITFPIQSPNPSQDKGTFYIKYPIYVGGNRGRGQVNPNGEKTNNTIITSSAVGKIQSIEKDEKGSYLVTIKGDTSNVTQTIPAGLDISVRTGEFIKLDQPLTYDPNVGGFGQNETEIVLQNPNRVVGLITFFFTVVISQTFFVLKKKQFEKVQAAEMNF
uniref:Cytochrome f n=2 Tax=Pavlovaceae TaxID=418969 RepID=M1K3R6_DIALT|nr:apocytochrome f [Diacronema lutheri]YP_009863768.1 apocytochrome f [Pavlova sp. NIVA-4/92]AGE93746.1 apocytochrome f [Diacronema lutheri]QKE31099.1 apocytochrome f [Pavlova sp. NIVA-4/92]|mmetsp:Transcript_5311/g.16679  ORF Transcript_5311/g.16679 Transcript_5311/m.16679 type:complete len:315 (-) Transcript_5311:769-1713(-)